MDIIKIEKGIPLAKKKNNLPRHQTKYPFAKMKIGDSFLAPKGTTRNAMAAAAKYHGLKLGYTFTVRQVGKSFRCWRVK